MADLHLVSNSPDETVAIGKAIGALLQPGDFVALVGHLGAGKTHLTKGLVAGLGSAEPDEVNSPTFVLINEYAARIPVHHVDAYRVSDSRALSAIGFEELCSNRAVVILEWADFVRDLVPKDALWIDLTYTNENSRTLNLRTASNRLARDITAALDQFNSSDDKSTR